MNAEKNNKGCRLHLYPDEFWDKLKNAGRWIKEKIIDTDVYQKI